MIVGGYGDGGETFRANKDVDGAREAMRGSTGRARNEGRGLQSSYSKHSKNVAGCDPPTLTSGNLRIRWEMLRVCAKMHGVAEGGEDSPRQITRSRTGAALWRPKRRKQQNK